MEDMIEQMGAWYREVAPSLLAYFRHQPTLAAAILPGMPPDRLDLARLRRAQQVACWRARSAQVARLAAALTVGLGVGWLARPRSADSLASTVPSEIRAAQAPSSGFWSIEAHLNNPRPETTGASRYRLQWHSPVKMPRVAQNS